MRAAKLWLGTSASLVIVLAAPELLAQEPAPVEPSGSGFGEARPFVLSLENLGGVSQIRTEEEGDDEATTTTHAGTYFGLFPPHVPLPRIGLHYFVAPPISVGGIFHYSDNDSLGTNMMAGVRLGAAFPLSESMALWLRGGIAYVSHELDLGIEITFTDVRPGGELLLVLTPVEHFGFLIGGMFEMGIAGKQEVSGGFAGLPVAGESDFDYMEYGLTLGVLTDF